MPNHVVKKKVSQSSAGADWDIVWEAQSDAASAAATITMTLPEENVWYKNPGKKVLKKDAEKIADLVTAVLDYLLED